MSYSFTTRKPNKAEALTAALEQLVSVVDAQPSHETDYPVVVQALAGAIQCLQDSKDHDVVIHMYGSIATMGEKVQSVGVSITASSLPKPIEP